ncbi:hypothetical protein LEP1GSC050_4023 [Leptospira broomii serovar Hurstbridge str. 5399]|uniref:Phosphate-selective porin O and P n=1 Tax=Leptospira broomii serovar Hurstbridge str. 5399 TaxID=1049789 RepID=T0F9W1_9LEPT|nr:hypothetical protein [Leptospira broomii]EQA44681.1 hypothetical protein LEP1GSC050_4023 [Leptospira broomii serovar Hurstbridge str. 5399]
MNKLIRRIAITAFLLPLSGNLFSKDLYVDKTTGQVFAAPGANRVKMQDDSNAPTQDNGNGNGGDKVDNGLTQENNFQKGYGFTDVPNQSAHRPRDPQKEKLTIYGRLQFRGIAGSKDTNYSNGHDNFQAVDWNVRRLRLGAMYEGADWWGGLVNIRLENLVARPELSPATTATACTNAACTQTTTVVTKGQSLANNRGAVQEAVVWLQSKYANSRISLGQLNVPFNREYIASSQNLVNIERSMITAALPQFDMGAMLNVHPLKQILGDKYTQMLTVTGYVGNGRGAGGDYGTGRKIDLYNTRNGNNGTITTAPTYIWRVVFNPLGGLVNQVGKEVGWHEGEEIFQSRTKWSIGMAGYQTASFNTIANSTIPALVDAYPRGAAAVNIVTPQSTPDNGTPGASTNGFGFGIPYGLPGSSNATLVQNNSTTPASPRWGLVAHTYDTTFYSNGIYVNAAYTKMSGPASNNTMGYHVTLGYNVPILAKYYIMPVVRYDYLQGDFNRDHHIDPSDAYRSYWAGLNLYLDKHLMKIQLFYNDFHTMLGYNPATGGAKALDNQAIILQAQFSFQTGISTNEKQYSAAEGNARSN